MSCNIYFRLEFLQYAKIQCDKSQYTDSRLRALLKEFDTLASPNIGYHRFSARRPVPANRPIRSRHAAAAASSTPPIRVSALPRSGPYPPISSGPSPRPYRPVHRPAPIVRAIPPPISSGTSSGTYAAHVQVEGETYWGSLDTLDER